MWINYFLPQYDRSLSGELSRGLVPVMKTGYGACLQPTLSTCVLGDSIWLGTGFPNIPGGYCPASWRVWPPSRYRKPAVWIPVLSTPPSCAETRGGVRGEGHTVQNYLPNWPLLTVMWVKVSQEIGVGSSFAITLQSCFPFLSVVDAHEFLWEGRKARLCCSLGIAQPEGRNCWAVGRAF